MENEFRWISVDERFPDNKDDVLCYLESGSYCIFSYMEHHRRKGAKTWVDEHFDESSSYGEAEFGVTHWMVLPKPPRRDHGE